MGKKKVIFASSAWRDILAETVEHFHTETGLVWMGFRDGDIFYVLEAIEPGPDSILQPAYFEYDDKYISYRAEKIMKSYEAPIALLGLVHRHPGVLKRFSSTDDETNQKFADLLKGVISGIITLGNGLELTLFYMDRNGAYESVEWEICDEKIPEWYQKKFRREDYEAVLGLKSVIPDGESCRERRDHDDESDGDPEEIPGTGSGRTGKKPFYWPCFRIFSRRHRNLQSVRGSRGRGSRRNPRA